jgi:hypothetical protein
MEAESGRSALASRPSRVFGGLQTWERSLESGLDLASVRAAPRDRTGETTWESLGFPLRSSLLHI